ncbi:toxic anion resistance protein [Pullulanibacillus sp. KACC 23026]|uniref:toxic anion resistance protein n=1 Tax=Pullulanibacillus sp. KACC 23026 TaxID=3028315 RepID=UPI0023AECC99|nr:toxic anion resistance protein [Pullulanibacillus sp. KACC 23026]WEG12973.1 toxic anion resistance protein [Pullulanibacillus sp. KACC 23026]
MSMNETNLQVLDQDKKEEALQKANELRNQLRQQPEVKELARTLDVKDQIALLEFGKEPANEVSNFASRVLNTVKSSSMEESSALLKNLGKIMDKFDAKDFAEEKGFMSKIFGKGKKMIDRIMSKYQTMGGEIDKVYVEIKKYEDEMKKSTNTLEQLYDENFKYYLELEKYIVAADLKAEEIRQQKLPQLEERANAGDQLAAMELDSTRNALELIEQRSYDLEMAKQVAFQSAPQIRMLQRGNTKLIAKINSAFVTTIPIFKTSLINAIAAKRQKLVADSMSELDRRTNEMLIKNAQNISTQSAQISRLAGASGIKIETIEETWGIIVRGLEETKAIEDENKRQREDGRRRLEEIQANYQKLKEKMAPQQ